MNKFEWHDEKALINQKKHKVTFDEAKTVFDDPLAIYKPDLLHSIGEVRSYIIGYSIKNKLLVVSFSERGEYIRLITARLASKNEKKTYENQS